MSARPTPEQRLANPSAVLTRTDLAELGWERRAIDGIFRAVPKVHVPGYSRPVLLVSDYLEALRQWRGRDDRVRA